MKKFSIMGGLFLAAFLVVQAAQAATISGKIYNDKGTLVQQQGIRIDTCLGNPQVLDAVNGTFSFTIADTNPFCVILSHPSLQTSAIRAANARVPGFSYRYQIANKDCGTGSHYPCGPLRRRNDLARDDAFDFVLSGLPSTQNTVPMPQPVPSQPTSTSPVVVPTVDGLNISLDPDKSMAESWVVAGSSAVPVTTLKVTAGSENLMLQSVGLVVESAAAGNPIVRASIWDGGIKRGEAAFGNAKTVIVPIEPYLLLPAHSSKTLTVRVDVAGLGTGAPGLAGEWFSINYDAARPEHTVALKQITVESRQAVTKTISAAPRVRYFRSLPHISKMELPASDLKSDLQVIYKFRIEPDPANKISLGKVTFEVATSNVTAFAQAPANFLLYDVTAKKRVAMATGTSAEYYRDTARYTKDGKLIVSIPVDTADRVTAAIVMPAGEGHVFELRADVQDLGNGTVSTRLIGDEDLPGLSSVMGTLEEIEASAHSNFIWSDHSADIGGQHSLISSDWMNGYKVPGLVSLDNTPMTLVMGARTSQYWANVLEAVKSQLQALLQKIQ